MARISNRDANDFINVIKLIRGKGIDDSDYNKFINALRSYGISEDDANNKNLDDLEEQIKRINNLKSAHKSLLSDILDKYEDINDVVRLEERLQKSINKEVLEQINHLETALDIKKLEERLYKEGLTFEEKRTKLLMRQFVLNGRNYNMFKKGIDEFKNGINSLKSGFRDIINLGKKALEPWQKIDQEAFTYARRLGTSKLFAENLRSSTIKFASDRSIGSKYGFTGDEMIKQLTDYSNNISRQVILTDDQKEDLLAISKILGNENAILLSSKMEEYGKSVYEVGEDLTELFKDSSKFGISAEKYSKNLADNISIAQSYTFDRGLNGVKEMAKLSTVLKMNMDQALKAADKVSTLEGAMQAGARLSVLGGPFARMGNPMAMLYEGLNDVESLQKRIATMFGDLAKWDYSKGEFTMTSYNRQLAKAASESLGLDANNMFQMIFTSARRKMVEKQIGGGVNESDAELIKNTAQIDKEGKAYITGSDGNKLYVSSLNEIDEKTRRGLLDRTKTIEDNVRDIAVSIRGAVDMQEGLAKQSGIEMARGVEATGIGSTVKEIQGKLGEIHSLIRAYAWLPVIVGAIGSLGTIIKGSMMIGNSTGNIIRGNRRNGNLNRNILNGGGTSGTSSSTRGTGTGSSGSGRSSSGGGVTEYNRKKNIVKTRRALRGGGAVAGGLAAATMLGNATGVFDKNDTWKAVGDVANGAAMGASIGSILAPYTGGISIAVGAGLGALYGGIQASNEKAKKRLLEEIQEKHGVVLNGDYSRMELSSILKGRNYIDSDLVKKMNENGDNINSIHKYADGGVVNGEGTSKSDSILSYLSNGEFVMPAKETEKNIGLLTAMKNGANIGISKEAIKPINIILPENRDYIKSIDSEQNININVGGRVTLEMNGYTKEIKPSEILNSKVVDEIIRQIHVRTNYSLNKDKLHKKYY